MKIAVITLTSYDNYGNRLQNFAVQQILKSLGADVETIEVKYIDSVKLTIRMKKVLLYCVSALVSNKFIEKYVPINFKKKLIFVKNKKLNNYREKQIYNWSNKHIKNSLYKIINNKVCGKLNNEFDFFVTGSDQVWNPYYFTNMEPYFLNFVDLEKRISYAASFGVNDIPKERVSEYKKLLKSMKYISVREEAGKSIVENLTDKEATVVVDPTMLLGKDEWIEVTSKPSCMPDKKYILTYFLGEKNEEYNKFIESLVGEKSLEVIDILDITNKDIYCVDPGEFVYLINHADVMITDSFHGAVFSILMETPFVIFERQDECVSMNSRIETLVTTFKMESRLSSHIKSVEDVYNIDFNHIDEILKYEREKAIRYLKNAFSIE